MSAANSLRLLHELQVHQVELEMQNEELMRARAEVVAEKFSSLYDFAPILYITLGRDGIIRDPRSGVRHRRADEFSRPPLDRIVNAINFVARTVRSDQGQVRCSKKARENLRS